ncbi:hypothetical protein ACGFYQ_39980 [Streptomyces sp. NPDC048258]|uniref:hypothetical protein n=1 Tax=Streptomyces sp. NPDC048258 TaxID=3365527 RepID=UPI00372187BB
MPQMSKVELYAAIRRDHRGGMNMASRTNRRPNEFRVVELILGAVTEAGLDGAEAAVHYRMVGDSLLAYVGQRAAYLLFDPDVRAADESSWSRKYRHPAEHPAGRGDGGPDLPGQDRGADHRDRDTGPVAPRDLSMSLWWAGQLIGAVDGAIRGVPPRSARP